MADYTRLTNLEVTGDMKYSGLSSSAAKITSADATAAAGTAPTKAEFDKTVALCNELKATVNALIDGMK